MSKSKRTHDAGRPQYAGAIADTIIVSDAGFWNGRRWVDEYPDAMLHEHWDAMSTAKRLAKQFPGCGEIHVVKNYGMADATKTLFKWED